MSQRSWRPVKINVPMNIRELRTLEAVLDALEHGREMPNVSWEMASSLVDKIRACATMLEGDK